MFGLYDLNPLTLISFQHISCCTQCLHPSQSILCLPCSLPDQPSTAGIKWNLQVKTMPSTKQEAQLGHRIIHTLAPHTAAPEKIWEEQAKREGHQHEQTMGRINAHNTRTYLHPLPVDFHEEDAERVGFGGDIPVQKVLATDGQLDLADTVLGADRRRRRGRHGVRHGPRWQQLQALCGTAQGQTSVLAGTKHPASTAELGTHSVATGTASCSQSHTTSRLHPPSCSSSRCPECKPSTAPMTCCEFAPEITDFQGKSYRLKGEGTPLPACFSLYREATFPRHLSAQT